MQLEDIKKYCVFTEAGRKLLIQAYNKLNLSNRSYLNIIKLSQSISDLESSSKIKDEHISEAIQYRIKDNNLLY
jgi:magnesium chelatase family protein